MDEQRLIRVSKYLSRHLRHRPERIGIRLDEHGWVAVPELLRAAARHGFPIERAELETAVAANDKRRFALDARTDRIRAQQGHSVPVDLDLPPREPPAFLFHGTVARFLPAIHREGLRPMGRHAVHLSTDRDTALRVGARRGRAVVLTIRSGEMHRDGHVFQLSGNGVWLVAAVPPGYVAGDRS
ncbi:RNA 2'-phosphotransferase [Streptomyces durbertensis]|uniref:Probable RNA 2'-phosphotransferase n=1 Tax=Streptomyces durbertensis TaxID=2448886 RepID=A0ABR6EMP9_9ACTN|nr:RNA 2'-phosphotransferase [Streptomyces durbertensis]MBB1246616.1 RNA 2'-phosphotransferase [Streptomyces durbertensis]